MRVFSWITGGLLLAIVGLFVYQNLPTFNGLVPFSLDFHIHEAFTWFHRVYTVIGMAALLGFLLGLLVMLKPYLKNAADAQGPAQSKRAGPGATAAPGDQGRPGSTAGPGQGTGLEGRPTPLLVSRRRGLRYVFLHRPPIQAGPS